MIGSYDAGGKCLFSEFDIRFDKFGEVWMGLAFRFFRWYIVALRGVCDHISRRFSTGCNSG